MAVLTGSMIYFLMLTGMFVCSEVSTWFLNFTCRSSCQNKGCEPAQSQRRAGSVSECFWGWKEVPQVPGTQLWWYHSQYDASAATRKVQQQRGQGRSRLDIRWLRTTHEDITDNGVQCVSQYLLLVVGCVGQHRWHMEHDLIILIGCVQGVSACWVSWGGDRGMWLSHKLSIKTIIKYTHTYTVWRAVILFSIEYFGVL